MAAIKVGNPQDPAVYMGPLISEKQRDKVDGIVQRAIAAGATLAAGGQRIDPGYFYTPTLLTGVDPDSEVAQDELFGPVLAVIPFEDDDDAVRIANNSIFGLSGHRATAGTTIEPFRRGPSDPRRHGQRQRWVVVRTGRPIRRLQAVGNRA